MKIGLVTTLMFFLLSVKIFAQVLSSDSLALVDFYNATSGNSWGNKANWLSGIVGSWQGITIDSNRVTNINLSGNNLSGSLPISFCNLTRLKYLYLSDNNLSGNLPSCFGNLISLNTIDFRNNKFTGAIPSTVINFPKLADIFISNNQFDQLPDLSSLTEFSNLLVQNNKFTFEDLEPNIGVLNFQYIPQDSVDIRTDTIVDIKDTAKFQAFCGGSSNQYQWTKNGTALAGNSHFQGTATSFLTINKVALSDEGYYACIVKSSIIPGLTLYRKLIHIAVNDTRLTQIITVVPGSNNVCGDKPSVIKATTNSTLSLSYSILTSNGQLKADTLIPFLPGSVALRIYNYGDDTYKPVIKDTIIIINFPTITSIEIAKTIPTELGGALELSVPFQAATNFLWINPQKDTTFANIYNKNVVNENDEGTYTIKVGMNNCYYFSENVVVEFASLHTLIVYELVSPDGDGKNDVFYIQNIEKYQDSEVTIFNTWNQTVFKKSNYVNDWSGSDLPGGTYYYIVKIPSLNKLVKGSLYLKK